MAARSVMPVYSIGLIELNSLCEVLDSLFILEEPVPDQATSIIAGCVMLILHQDLVEVFKCHRQTVSTNLLTNRTQVVYSLDVLRLQLDRQQIVILGLFEIADLVPAEGPVVKGLEVTRIELDSLRVVVDCSFKVALLAIREASVVEEVSLRGLQIDRLSEALDCEVVVAPSVQ